MASARSSEPLQAVLLLGYYCYYTSTVLVAARGEEYETEARAGAGRQRQAAAAGGIAGRSTGDLSFPNPAAGGDPNAKRTRHGSTEVCCGGGGVWSRTVTGVSPFYGRCF